MTTYRQTQELLEGLLRSKAVRVQAQDKFSYAWGKNYDKLISIQKVIEKRRYPEQTDATKKFMKEVSKIGDILKERDVQKENYEAEYKIEADRIEKLFPDVKKYYDDHNKAFEAWLDTDVEFEPYVFISDIKFHGSDMPEMTLEQRAGISFMVME